MNDSFETKLQTAKLEGLLWAKDLADQLLGRRDPLTPPRRMMFDGPRDRAAFAANGAEFLRYYRDLCHLQPDETILDIGSGIGRKTIPLTRYLSQAGRYEGLDVNKMGVDWCQQQITSRFPNFHFQQIDVYSSRYNPTGTQQADNYQVPFAQEHFDFAVLASVFTHMFAAGVQRYLTEIARVLKPGTGRCLISYFLLNPESEQLQSSQASGVYFPAAHGVYRVKSAAQPEDAVAFDEAYIRQIYAACGLEIVQIYYGSWCGRKDFLSYQDLILARKR